tara:strand:+ start:265 stop:1314 length:1050 start_codon:yes stop_codon:yes gene_type:complete
MSVQKQEILNNENDDNKDKDSSENSLTAAQDKIKLEWSPENENILVEWCDFAQCYKWLNSRAHAKYSYWHAWFTIPAIIFSTISGTASFAQSSLPTDYQEFSPMIIGSINIIVGILTTIQQYLKISELNEAHRVSAIAWDKFARNIKIELSKHPNERVEAKIFIKVCRQEFDRLMETSPDIRESIIKEFNQKFVGKEGSKRQKKFELLRKPDICDRIVSVNESRHKWYKQLENHIEDEFDDLADNQDKLIKEQQDLLQEKNQELEAFAEKEKTKLEKQLELMKSTKEEAEKIGNFKRQQIALITTYINSFVDLYERKPLKEEITSNMEDTVDNNILIEFLETYDEDSMV